MIDVLHIPDILDPPACEALRAELAVAAGTAAGLLAAKGTDVVRPQIRNTTRLKMPPATMERVARLFEAQREALERHFGLRLGVCEEPQFLRYQAGDFFVAHQDGNTPLIFDHSRTRRVSAILFLSHAAAHEAPGCYGGGELIMHGHYSGPMLRVPVQATAGALVAFRSETTHEVMPVTHGERISIVSWFHAPTDATAAAGGAMRRV